MGGYASHHLTAAIVTAGAIRGGASGAWDRVRGKKDKDE